MSVILGAAVMSYSEGATRRGNNPRTAIEATEQILWGDPDNPTAPPFRRFGAHRLYYLWLDWDTKFPNADVADDIAKGRMPVINFRPIRGTAPGIVYYSDIYNGLVNADIDGWAQAVKNYAPTVLGVSFDAEPWDGIGNPSINPDKHGSTTEYCRAWKYIVDRWKGPINNVTNVKFCNNLTAWDYESQNVSTHANPLWGVGTQYALENVVDAAGADGYQWFPCRPDNPSSWEEFETIFNPPRVFAKSLRGGVGIPLWVLETGCQENDGYDQYKGGYPTGPGGYWCPDKIVGQTAQPTRKAAWFTNMQTALRDDPKWSDVEMVLYFDQLSEGVDAWWLDSRESSRAAFEAVGRDPFFNGGGTVITPTVPKGLIYATGFEHGVYKSRVSEDTLYGAGIGTPTVQSTTKLHGTYALEVNPANSSDLASFDFEFDQNYIVASVAFRLASPGMVGGNGIICTVYSNFNAVDAIFRIRASDGKINATWSDGTAEDGPVITTNVWHLLEFKVNMTNQTIEWRVDHVAQTTLPSTGGDPDQSYSLSLGTGQTTVTYTMQFDDLLVSNIRADYPIGDVEMVALRPNEILDIGGSTQGIPPASGTQWPGSLGESPPSFVGLPNATPDALVPQVTDWAGAPTELGGAGTGTEEEFRVRWVMRKAGTNTVFVCGGFTGIGNQTRLHLAAIDITDGSSNVITAFNPTVDYGPATAQALIDDPSEMIRGMAIDSTGNYIYIVGNFEFVNGVARNGLAKIKISDGTLDSAWAPEILGSGYGICTFGTLVYVCGGFTQVKPSAAGAAVTRNRIAAFLETTGAVQTFNPNVNGTVRQIRISPDGTRLSAIGNFSHLGAAAPSGFDRNMIAHINTSNSNATNFEPTWPVNPSAPQVCYSMCLSPDGTKLYVGVDGALADGGNRIRKFEVGNPTAAGVADNELWNAFIGGDSGDVQGIAATDSYVFVGHHGNGETTGHGKKIYVCNAATGVILSWDSVPRMDSTFSGVFQLVATADALVVGGSMWGSKPRRGIAVYRASIGQTATSNFTQENGTTPITTADWARLDDWPPGTDGIAQAAADASDFVEIGFENISAAEVAPVIFGVQAEMAFHSSGGGINSGGAFMYDGAEVSPIFPAGDMGDVGTNKTYRATIVNSEGDLTWTKPKVAALTARFGYSGDVVPLPIWDAFLLEVAISRGGRTLGSVGNAYAVTSGLGVARSDNKGVTTTPQVVGTGQGIGHGTVVAPPPPPPQSPFLRRARHHYGLGSVVHSFIGRAGSTVTLQLENWVAEESVNAGYGAASGNIPGKVVEKYAEVFKDGAKWFSYVAEEGEIIWAGRLLPVNIVNGVAQLKGKGVAEIANTKFDRYLLQNRFYGDWTSMGSEPHNYNVGDSYDFSVNGGALTWKLAKGQKFTPGGQDGAVFWGTGVDITRFKFRLQVQGGNNAFSLKLDRANGPSGGRSAVSGASWGLQSGGPTGVQTVTIGAAQDQLILYVEQTTGTAVDPMPDTVRVDVTDIIVNGLAKGDEFSASQVVRTVTDRLGVSPILITPLATNVMPMDFTDGSHGEVLDYVCLLTDTRYRFIDLGAAGIACDYGPWDEHVWQSVRNEQPVDLVPLERYNKIRVPYRRNSGGTGNITVTATAADMDYENEFTEVGLDQPLSNDSVAKGFGQKLLEYLITSRYGGSALLAEVVDLTGTTHTAHHIHAGDTFKLQNGINLRITNVSRSAAGVRITFDEELAALNTLNAKRSQRLALRGRESGN